MSNPFIEKHRVDKSNLSTQYYFAIIFYTFNNTLLSILLINTKCLPLSLKYLQYYIKSTPLESSSVKQQNPSVYCIINTYLNTPRPIFLHRTTGCKWTWQFTSRIIFTPTIEPITHVSQLPLQLAPTSHLPTITLIPTILQPTIQLVSPPLVRQQTYEERLYEYYLAQQHDRSKTMISPPPMANSKGVKNITPVPTFKGSAQNFPTAHHKCIRLKSTPPPSLLSHMTMQCFKDLLAQCTNTQKAVYYYIKTKITHNSVSPQPDYRIHIPSPKAYISPPTPTPYIPAL